MKNVLKEGSQTLQTTPETVDVPGERVGMYASSH